MIAAKMALPACQPNFIYYTVGLELLIDNNFLLLLQLPKFRVEICKIWADFSLDFAIFWKFWGFLEIICDFPQFRQNSAKISTKNHRFWTISATFCKNLKKLPKFCKISQKICKFWIWSGAKVCLSCRSRKMLKKWVFGCKNRPRYSRERAVWKMRIW